MNAVWRAAVCGLLALVLSACGIGVSPFGKNQPLVERKGRPVPPVTLTAANGFPQERLPELRQQLQAQAQRRGITLAEGSVDDKTLGLTGIFAVSPGPGPVTLSYAWTLADKDGLVIFQLASEEPGLASGQDDPWSAVSPTMIARAADATMRSMAARLGDLGYAVQQAPQLPPGDVMAKATPGDAKAIDLETVNGPGSLALPPALETGSVDPADPPMTANNETDAMVAAVEEPPPEPVKRGGIPIPRPKPKRLAALQAPAAGPDAAPDIAEDIDTAAISPKRALDPPPIPNPASTSKSNAATKKSPGAVITAVAVLGVRGAPGKGNEELTAAMRKRLAEGGWPVLKAARADALSISGDVSIGPESQGAQNVALVWAVKTPDGRLLGTVKQANDVPAGSLDQQWGGAASAVAEGAADGIYDLIRKYR